MDTVTRSAVPNRRPAGRAPAPFRPGRAALLVAAAVLLAQGCDGTGDAGSAADRPTAGPTPRHTLTAEQVHSRFSRTIEPVLRVKPGAVVEAHTQEASAGQLTPESTAEDLAELDFDPIHPLTGPVYVEGAEPGDILVVRLHEVEVGDWGWSAVIPGFGFLSDEFTEPYLKTYRFEPGDSTASFGPGIDVPLRPFPGVVGVAPDTDSLLSTIPPRANGGNLDDRDVVEGTTVYLPVFVEGALFSVGDGHAAQGDGEVSGTAIEAPLRIVYQVSLIRDPARPLPSPQYASPRVYAVTGIAETIDEAARRATRHMVDYLHRNHGLGRTEAYVLASTAAHLKVAEAVDVPHMMVTMQIPLRLLPHRRVAPSGRVPSDEGDASGAGGAGGADGAGGDEGAGGAGADA